MAKIGNILLNFVHFSHIWKFLRWNVAKNMPNLPKNPKNKIQNRPNFKNKFNPWPLSDIELQGTLKNGVFVNFFW